MRAAAERYLALLDHDDVILPGAYTILIDELCKSGTAIAFGSVAAKEVDIFHDAVLVEKRREIFRGQGLTDLLRENFREIHSFVVDRGEIRSQRPMVRRHSLQRRRFRVSSSGSVQSTLPALNCEDVRWGLLL